MSDRKVLNFYYSPDFDPALVPKRKFHEQIKIRIMLPFSLQCNTCGSFTYKGKKFNGRKEDSMERYLGIPIFRFYFRCPNCAAELTFKTDPKNSDYTCERGATRNFEQSKAQREATALLAQERANEERGDAMKQLENRTLDSKREMEQQDALEELRERSVRGMKLDLNEMLAEKRRQIEAEQQAAEAEDEEAIKALFHGGGGKRVVAEGPNGVRLSALQDEEILPVDDDAPVEEDFHSAFSGLQVSHAAASAGAGAGAEEKSEGVNGTSGTTIIAPAAAVMSAPTMMMAPPKRSVVTIVKKKTVAGGGGTMATADAASSPSPSSSSSSSNGGAVAISSTSGVAESVKPAPAASSTMSLLSGYGSDDDDED